MAEERRSGMQDFLGFARFTETLDLIFDFILIYLLLLVGKKRTGGRGSPIVDVRGQLVSQLAKVYKLGSISNIISFFRSALRGEEQWSENRIVSLFSKVPEEGMQDFLAMINKMPPEDREVIIEALHHDPILQWLRRIKKRYFPWMIRDEEPRAKTFLDTLTFPEPQAEANYQGFLAKLYNITRD